MFDFDRIIERRGTHSTKWDNIARLSGIESPDAIAMWVADMDFAAPPGVTSALTAEIQCAVHGYYADTGSWAAALVSRGSMPRSKSCSNPASIEGRPSASRTSV